MDRWKGGRWERHRQMKGGVGEWVGSRKEMMGRDREEEGQTGRGRERRRNRRRGKKGRTVDQCETNNEVGMSKSHQSKPSIKRKGRGWTVHKFL